MRNTVLFIAMGWCVGLSATQAAAANLGEMFQLALSNDATYAAARESHRAGLEALPQGKSLLRPTVSLSSYLRRNDAETSAPSDSTYSSRGYSLSLTQPLYNKPNFESYEQSRLAVLLAEQQLLLAGQDLMLRVATAYFEVLLAQDTLATVQAQMEAVAEQLAQAKKSFEVGASTIVDTHEAQARYDVARSQEIAARNDLQVKRRSLEKIIAREAPALAGLTKGAHIPLPAPGNMDEWVKQAEDSSLGVLTAHTALETARRSVEIQRGGHLPTLNLAASYSDNRNASSGATSLDTKSAVLGLELGWVLYQGGATTSKVRETLALQEKARFDLDAARRQAAFDTRQAFLGVMSGDAQVKALQQALVSSESQLQSTKLGLEVGVRTRVDVLNAQQLVFSTQRDLASARYQTILSSLRLKAAAGVLAETDLKALDALLH